MSCLTAEAFDKCDCEKCVNLKSSIFQSIVYLAMFDITKDLIKEVYGDKLE